MMRKGVGGGRRNRGKKSVCVCCIRRDDADDLVLLVSIHLLYCGRCIRASSFLASVGQGPRKFLARLRLDFRHLNPGRRTGLKQA